MRKLAVIIVLCCVIAGCEQSNGDQPKPVNIVTTIGNHSYVNILGYYLDPNRDNYGVMILNTVGDFEKAHPDLEITNWRVQMSFNTAYATGIFIDHRPKTEKVGSEK